MNPPRLSVSGNDLETRLLCAGRAESPSRASKKRAAAAAALLAVGTDAGVGVLAKRAAHGWLFRIVGAILGIAGIGLALYFGFPEAKTGNSHGRGSVTNTPAETASPVPARTGSPAVESPSDVATVSVAALPSVEPLPTTTALTPMTTAPPAKVAPPVTAAPRASAAKAATPPTSTGNEDRAGLAAELALVRRAKRALASGDAPGALTLLDEYALAFPRGKLAEEAAAIRVEALATAGETEAARSAGARFFQQYPSSPYGERVRSSLAPR